MKAQIAVTALREADGDRDENRFLAAGEFFTSASGSRIIYRNTGEGMEDVVSTLTVTDNRVVIVNTGRVQSELIVEPGQCHRCRYDTGYGILDMEIRGKTLVSHLRDCPRTLDFTYTLSVGGTAPAQHTLHLEIRPSIC